MEARELVAADIVADFQRFWEVAWGGRFNGLVSKVYATDKYTVVFEFENFTTEFMWFAGTEDRAIISPPELEKNNPDQWENQVGTGPWMFDEYAPGSHMRYAKNPNYWDQATIDGKKYQMPFADTLMFPIIPDASTQIAALRTGKVDLIHAVDVAQWELLEKTRPDLESSHYSIVGDTIVPRYGEPPFDKREVRQAMMIATDMKTFARLYQSEEMPIHWWPLYVGSREIYTPLEKLPAEHRELYEYDVEKAKKRLAAAGYPDGFKTAYYTVATPSFNLDFGNLLKDMWAKVGVDVDIVVVDSAELGKLRYEAAYGTGPGYKGVIRGGYQMPNTANILAATMKTGGHANWGGFSDPDFDALMDKILTEPDPAAQNEYLKETEGFLLEEVPSIPVSLIMAGHYWQPWLKNYYGELTIADSVQTTLLSYIWIDQEEKKRLGY
jgi:peptide/nickel transport system substrate-binding protein